MDIISPLTTLADVAELFNTTPEIEKAIADERKIWFVVLDAVIAQWKETGISLADFTEIYEKLKGLLDLMDGMRKMTPEADVQQSGILPKLSTVIDDEKIFKHNCGSYAFFAWGIKLVTKESIGNLPRLQDIAGDSEVMICAECLQAVVVMGGHMYDASDYISAEDVDKILTYGQSRNQVTPLKAMDA